MQAEADELRAVNQQLNKQFAAASNEVKTLKAQVRARQGPQGCVCVWGGGRRAVRAPGG